MSYLIREMREDDIDACLALGAKLHQESNFRHLPYERNKSRELGIKICSDPERKLFNNFIVEYDNKIIAMLVLNITEHWFNYIKICQDMHFYVDPDYRNRWPMMSIKLIRAGEQWAKRVGASSFLMANTSEIDNISDRLGKLFKFLKYKHIGDFYAKDI